MTSDLYDVTAESSDNTSCWIGEFISIRLISSSSSKILSTTKSTDSSWRGRFVLGPPSFHVDFRFLKHWWYDMKRPLYVP